METNALRFEHDEVVRRYALRLLSDGYEVWARVEGWFDPPDYIYGYRPDIVARRGDQFLIVEIQKGEVDWPKISALERYRQEHPEVHVLVVPSEEIALPQTGT